MTNEELDEATAKEAGGDPVKAARLAREGWTPPKPVDPDVLAFREWESAQWPAYTCTQAAFLAGARMATERERERRREYVDDKSARAREFRATLAKREGKS